MYGGPPSSIDASSIDPSAIDASATGRDDDDPGDRFRADVRAAFPDMSYTRSRVEQAGGDHVLLIVDETRAFRFPRRGQHGLDRELAVLRLLAPLTRVAVPAYDLVDPAGRFASYPLIPGVPLTPARFSSLTRVARRRVLEDAVTLLKMLHRLDARLVGVPAEWPGMWSPGQFADRIEHERLPSLAREWPAIGDAITTFLRGYRLDRAPRAVVLHGDLVGDHMLVDEATGRLAGIIDFSDVALGDPAQDLFGFWAYGADAATHAAGFYDDQGIDPTLYARSRNHFVRYRIDRFHDLCMSGEDPATRDRDAASLHDLLGVAAGSRPWVGVGDGERGRRGAGAAVR